jgi:hypothetical protein
MHQETMPDGGWVSLRDKEDMKVKHRRAVNSASIHALQAIRKLPTNLPTDGKPLTAADLEKIDMNDLNLSEEEADALQRVQEAAIWAQLAGWSYDEPLPAVSADVGEMNGDRYDALAELTRGLAADIVNGVDFAPEKEGPISTPGNPTGKPDGSATPSSDRAGRSTPRSRRGTTNSASASSST